MTSEQNLDFLTETRLETSPLDDAEINSCELNEMNWAVINAEECAVSGLTYEQARKFLGWLEKEGISGLCIVTNDAGARLSSNLTS